MPSETLQPVQAEAVVVSGGIGYCTYQATFSVARSGILQLSPVPVTIVPGHHELVDEYAVAYAPGEDVVTCWARDRRRMEDLRDDMHRVGDHPHAEVRMRIVIDMGDQPRPSTI